MLRHVFVATAGFDSTRGVSLLPLQIPDNRVIPGHHHQDLSNLT